MRKTYIQNGRDLERNRPIASEQPIPMNTVEKQIPFIATPDKSSGNAADTCCTPVQIPGEVKKSAENIDLVAEPSIVPVAAEPVQPPLAVLPERSPVVVGLSPRLEMRLALNNDIMGDEDLICYDPGPDLATILGHDLSTFHRFTGRDLISRSASRVQPKEAYISFSQQKNSKMDTPTPNRKKPSPNTWSNSASVVPGKHENICKYSQLTLVNERIHFARIAKEKNLTDLERLARQEKKFCTYQLKNSPATHPSTSQTKSTNHVENKSSKNKM